MDRASRQRRLTAATNKGHAIACARREEQRCHLRLVGRSLRGSAAGSIAGSGATGKHLVDEQEGGSDNADDDRDPRVHDRLQRDEAGESDNGESRQPPRG